MEETDIGRLFRILAEYQKLDPAIALKVLKRILVILKS